MSIATELALARKTKAEIAKAIDEMGVKMPAGTAFGEYPDFIRKIGMSDWGILYTTDFPDGKKITEADYNTLTGIKNTDFALSFGNVPRANVTGFDFGIMPTAVPDGFLYGCNNLSSPITIPENITKIGNNFLSGCTTFNSQLKLPEGLLTIGDQFMLGCVEFAQPLTLPESITTIGSTFMVNMNNFTGILEINCPYSVQGSEMGVISVMPDEDPPIAYTEGVKISGKYANEWKGKLGDITPEFGLPFLRKLIVVEGS